MPTRPGPEGSNRNTFFDSGRLPASHLIERYCLRIFILAKVSKDSEKKEVAQAYKVLARKYRPSTFSELIGQEAMVRTLTNAIASKRLPHAWMLTGVRGVGKTTTARIIARALNCTGADGKGGETIEPCGVCDSCIAIAEDRHVDVLEMDAASRTGVDDIRDIIEGVRYGPVSARYKIYILDEVHMLSKNAFNALLKTLEEPPPHTKFVFATTEIRKVPVTVLSRCQRFDLRRIEASMLAEHFNNIALKERFSIEEEAVKLIAHAADGSVRDGLSLLDQAIARGNGKVKTDDVKDMLGLADKAHSAELCRKLLRGEVAAALGVFNNMQQAGADSLQTLQDLCDLVHLLTKAQIIADFSKNADLSEADRQILTDLSDVKLPALTRAWQILLKGISEVQSAPHPVQAAEMVLVRLAYAAELPPPADLIKQLREQIGSGAASSPPAPSGGGGARAVLNVGNGLPVTSRPVAVAAVAVENFPRPQSFKDIVALFEEQREGALLAQLRTQVHPVKCGVCVLEVRLKDSAVPNLANKIGQCLTKWTGQRWMVSVSDAIGEPTLAEEEQAAEQRRMDKINSHPLMKSVLTSFPGAKIISLKQKVAPTASQGDNESSSEETTSLNDNED